MEVTPAKSDANRRNAEKSTGPKSPEGKSISSLNAVRHGLLSRRMLLPEEDQEKFAALWAGLKDQFRPVGVLEEMLLERIASLTWRLARVGQIESEMLQEGRGDLLALSSLKGQGLMYVAGAALGLGFDIQSANFSTLGRYETTLDRSLYRALHELQRLQASRKGQDVPLPVAVDINVDSKE